MKKLLLLAAMMISITTFAAPWDVHSQKVKVPLALVTDPYVTLYQSFDYGYMTQNHKLRLYVEFNQNVGVPYYAILRVYADYYDGSYYKDYTVTLYGSQSYKFQDFSLHYWDEPYHGVTELIEYGPQ